MRSQLAHLLACLSCLSFAAGCADDGHEGPSTEAPFQELYDQGVDRYLGAFIPSSSQPAGGGVLIHSFVEQEGGPLCYTGGQFDMLTRDGSGDELMIFLQGGGLCHPDDCEATEEWPLFIPAFGVLDPRSPGNPAAAFDVGYLPYCDGSLWTGDRDVDSDGDGENDRFFRGLQNLSAGLDVIAAAYPTPSRILLIGNSAGGFGVHAALPLVRALYPDVAIDVVNDSGMGIVSPGFMETVNDYWGSGSFYPASCADCIGEDGNLTGYHAWQLNEDPNLRMGFLSTKRDAVVAGALGGPTFEAELLDAMDELDAAYGDRFGSLIAEGDGHTFVLRDFDRVVGGVSVAQWIRDMIADADAWESGRD
jgi:hypothetical protein